jgi:predicted small lipoprotein YifL
MMTMHKVLRAAAPLVATALLAACGQRGDLYFPDEEREPVATLPASVLDPSQDDEPANPTQQGTPANPDTGAVGQ